MSDAPGITVGVDGSAPAAAALDWAAGYARVRALPLAVVTGVGWPGERSAFGARRIAQLKDAARADGEHLLARTCDDLRAEFPELPVTGHVSDETAVRALLAAAASSDTVVVGSWGLDAAASLLLGSVSAAVAAHAPVPVVVVHDDHRPGPDAPVVAGIDGSAQDDVTLGAAFTEAERWDAPLVVAHAWSDVSVVGMFGSAAVPSWIEARHEADELIDHQVGPWRAKYPGVPVGAVVEREQPARMLAELSATAGLTVVGAHGRGGFSGMRLGSVARRLVHHADGPLLVVR
ncbi:universal stress protein [Cryptosporangium japonicum]|uniref:Universal stress protein n=1 Tax=Cryptosporangium japonicum TaxID=80872 RepID=A0ABP3DUL6_9ACTN